MLNLFKRKNPYKWEIDLLVSVFASLPDQFKLFKLQIEDGLINHIVQGSLVQPNYVGFTYNPSIAEKYEDSNGRYYQIQNIKVFDKLSDAYIELQVTITNGLIMGYSTPKNKKVDIDSSLINVGHITIKYLDYDGQNILNSVLKNSEAELINPANVFEIELAGKTYFHILDLEDGDFIAFDSNQFFYEISHDPFKIERLEMPLPVILNNYNK